MGRTNITVLGAGVVGLTTALLLSENPEYKVTVVAKHMPGDYDIEYASPWAGANYCPVGTPGTLLQRLERDTAPELFRLARSVPAAGAHLQPMVIYNRTKDAGTPTGAWLAETLKPDAWFRDLVPDFRVLSPAELPEGVNSGLTFTSVCLNTPVYLSWLVSSLLSRGVTLRRATVAHVLDAADPAVFSPPSPTFSPPLTPSTTTSSSSSTPAPAAVIVNCTGLSSLHLPGVRDTALYPARGQIVLVRNPSPCMAEVSGTDDGPDEVPYVMARAAGGGTILGGCLQAHSWDPVPDAALARRIMRRAVALLPELVGAPGGPGVRKVTSGEGEDELVARLDVVRHGVGLRPMREGGPRVERERVGGRTWVVHNYGHGGYGYQSSYGTAMEAVRLVGECLREKARL